MQGFYLLLSSSLLWLLVHGYAPTDEDAICRVIRVDETSLILPQNRSYGALESITLTDDRDLTPLLENDNTLGPNATVRLDVQISEPASSLSLPGEEGKGLCVPYSLILTAGAGGLTVPLPAPERGWRPGVWQTIVAPIPSDAYKDANKAAWADLTRLEIDYNCDDESNNNVNMIKDAAIKIQLVRLCKTLATPNYCTVESTDVYKTECHSCNCQRCHDCDCIITVLGHCQFDACEECLCAPLCRCCYERDCGYSCKCETCCEDRAFTSCSKAISYGVQSITPSGGPEAGGTRVVVTSTSTFVETPHLSCLFGNAVVKGLLLSPTQIVCVSPEAPSISHKEVPVEVSLDGQHWTSNDKTFKYCQAGEECHHEPCPKGWKGSNCTIECLGGASSPCNDHGLCLDDPAGSCVCQPGYRGEACEEIGPSSSSTDPHMSESSSSDLNGGNRKNGTMKQGVLLGIGLSIMVLVLAIVAIYIKRAEVTEYIYWTLAHTRFQRLHPESPGDQDSPRHHHHPASSLSSHTFELGPMGREGDRTAGIEGEEEEEGGGEERRGRGSRGEINLMRHTGGRSRMGGGGAAGGGYARLHRAGEGRGGEGSELLEATRVAERLEQLERDDDEDVTVI